MKPQPFEGPEKKLEVILFEPQAGLRNRPQKVWEQAVKAAQAEIISHIAGPTADAWLLSESSLFVWDDRILMITCGQTQLTAAIPEIIQITGRDAVAMLFYERRNFIYPDQQPSNFEAEVEQIQPIFSGKSYRLGPANHDHVHVFYSSHAAIEPSYDATLQILMDELAPAVMDIFTVAHSQNAAQTLQQSGLNTIYPYMRTDAWLFEPSGFSVNAIADKNYYTAHVTPQRRGSYASFETNVLERDYSDLIRQVIHLFQPRKYSLVLTSSMDERCFALHDTLTPPVNGYNITEKSLYEFDCGYAVSFLNLTQAS